MKKKTSNAKISVQEVTSWCNKEGKSSLKEVKEKVESVVSVFTKAQMIDPGELKQPCTI